VYQLKLTMLFKETSKRITDRIIRRPLFPLNVSIVTVGELNDALNRHVSFLKNAFENAKRASEKLESLKDSEETFFEDIRKIESLGALYQKFWEQDIPESLEEKKENIIQEYKDNLTEIEQKIQNFQDFITIETEISSVIQSIERLHRESQRLIRRYEELFDEIERYFRAGSKFIFRLQDNVIPKLIKSDKMKIDEIINKLQELYTNTLNWLESLINQILEENISIPEITKTRTTIFEEERNLREALINEIKDLDEERALILLEIVKVLASRRAQWLSVSEVCERVAKQLNKNAGIVKKTLIDITEKGYLTLGIGF